MNYYARLSEEAKIKKRANASLWNRTHRDRRNARLRKWCKNNPEARFMRYWRHRLKKKYGLTVKQYAELLDEQNYLCRICGQPLVIPTAENRIRNGQSFVVDHIEGTKIVRGLLHNNCNRAIGFLGHNPEVLRRAANYVEWYSQTSESIRGLIQ